MFQESIGVSKDNCAQNITKLSSCCRKHALPPCRDWVIHFPSLNENHYAKKQPTANLQFTRSARSQLCRAPALGYPFRASPRGSTSKPETCKKYLRSLFSWFICHVSFWFQLGECQYHSRYCNPITVSQYWSNQGFNASAAPKTYCILWPEIRHNLKATCFFVLLGVSVRGISSQ